MTVVKQSIWRRRLSVILEKVEYRHSDDAALSALFQEFGSARYVNYESSYSSSPSLPSLLSSLLVLVSVYLQWVQ